MIRVRHLTKTYRVPTRPPGVAAAVRAIFRRRHRLVTAVDDVSFDIEEGERVGFLGPNGAGKTTTIKVLAGLLHPTGGEVEVAGFTPARRNREFLRTIMMVAGQKQQLLWDLPPSETFELNRAIYGVPRERFRATLDELVALLELEPLLDKPTRQLSLGERMRCELAAALLHEPRVLFLDEPTIGLDVTAQATLRAFVRRYNESRDATVLLTSHYMDDVAALCPRILVIDQGKLSYDGSLSQLARELRPDRRVTLRLGPGVERAAVEALGARVLSLDEDLAVLQVGADELRPVVARALADLPVLDLAVEEAPLEEVIADLFAGTRAERSRAGEDREVESEAESEVRAEPKRDRVPT
jgi:ABC-2 type transport system ATP-binding protein